MFLTECEGTEDVLLDSCEALRSECVLVVEKLDNTRVSRFGLAVRLSLIHI